MRERERKDMKERGRGIVWYSGVGRGIVSERGRGRGKGILWEIWSGRGKV